MISPDNANTAAVALIKNNPQRLYKYVPIVCTDDFDDDDHNDPVSV